MAKIRVPPRLSSIEPFKVMEVLRRAIELSSDGADIVHMAVGEPDFPTPEPITLAGRDALMNDSTKYTDARGLAELRLAVANYYAIDYGLDVDGSILNIARHSRGGGTYDEAWESVMFTFEIGTEDDPTNGKYLSLG